MTTLMIVGMILGLLFTAGIVIICASLWWTTTKIVLKISAWIVGVSLVILVVVLWWKHPKTPPRDKGTREPGMSRVQPTEEWILEWSLPPGQYVQEQNSATFEARILKNDCEYLWFDTYYTCGGSAKVSNYVLSKSGDVFVGSWSQRHPKDEGSIYLKRIGETLCWTGEITDLANNHATVTLRRK
jgi:hypothetical protein